MPQMEHDVKNLEHMVLIRCLHQGNGAVNVEELRAALGRITDWEAIRRTALDHGVFPSLYRRVADTCPEAVPTGVLGDWQKHYKVCARRNLRLTGELLKVLAFFESHGITAMPIKGPVLAQVAYGDVALRQFGDLDILVHRRNIPQVKDLLVALGYKPSPKLTPRQERAHLEHNHELSFFHPQLTMLDIHWGFADFPGGGLDPDQVFERKVQVQLQGQTVFSLTPEDMLLLLCQHAAFHLWLNLGVVNDVARLLKLQETWAWQGLMQQAASLGLKRRLLLGLSLAWKLLAATLPTEVSRLLESDPTIPTLQKQVLAKLFEKDEERGLLERIGRNWFHVIVRERFQDKVRYVWVRLTAPAEEDWHWVSLPDYCYWLYYVVRPVRLAVQGLILPIWRRLKFFE